MPMYDYQCLDCGKESLVVLTLKEHEFTKVTCPKCSSSKMKQLYTSFVAHTTKKSYSMRKSIRVKRRIGECSSSETFHLLRFTFHEQHGFSAAV